MYILSNKMQPQTPNKTLEFIILQILWESILSFMFFCKKTTVYEVEITYWYSVHLTHGIGYLWNTILLG